MKKTQGGEEKRGRSINEKARGDLARIEQIFSRLASVLLRTGVDSPQAEALLRLAFIATAVNTASKRANRSTQSEVASLAGVSRLEVRRYFRLHESKKAASYSVSPSRLERLIDGWRNDPDFQDKNGRPKPLSKKGQGSEFAKLSKKYGKDVTPRTLLNGLIEKRLARSDGKLVVLLDDPVEAKSRGNPARADLRFLEAQVSGFDFDSGRRTYINRDVSLNTKNQKVFRRLHRIAISRAETMLDSLQAMGSGRVTTKTIKAGPVPRLRVTVTIAAMHAEESE